MENKIKSDTEHWVEERMTLLAAPEGWEPNADVARTRLQSRLSARRHNFTQIFRLRVVTVALVCLVMLFAIPTTRVVTHQVWQWLTVQKIEVVHADFRKLQGIWLVPQIHDPIVIKEGEKPPPLPPLPPAVDITEAARLAGFTPRLSPEGASSATLVLRVFDKSMVWSTTLNVANMEASLRQAGVNDQPIPKEWDGAQVSLTIRSAISAVWDRGEISLFQHPPIALSVPAGFDITLYWTSALRAAGVNREQAERLAERMRKTPTLLLGIASNNKKAIHEVELRTGSATFIEDLSDPGRQVMLIWSVEDRVYHLSARSYRQAILAANSIE